MILDITDMAERLGMEEEKLCAILFPDQIKHDDTFEQVRMACLRADPADVYTLPLFLAVAGHFFLKKDAGQTPMQQLKSKALEDVRALLRAKGVSEEEAEAALSKFLK